MKSLLLALLLIGCSNPQPGPDKSLEGGVLGGAWGAGAGAVIGNQVATAGLGAGVGAGFGAAAGILNGVAYDELEGSMLKQKRALDTVTMRNRANFEKLTEIQDSLDARLMEGSGGGIYQVFLMMILQV